MSGSVWDKARQVLGAVAPTVATALGGPLAGVAVKAVAGALLGNEDAPEEEVAMAIAKATPEQLLAIKKVDADLKVRFKELDVDLERIAASDRDSARRREVDAGGDWTPRILAVVIVIAWCAVQYTLLTEVIDPSMRELVARVLGTLDAALMAVLYYYFGSSAGSARKTEALAASRPARPE